ncbi:hypothetical protein AB0E83_05695 [Streptomyces sp. NPDC035033]|uniref:hypothetical protein n=1 Tax=Streptomyces sp. NPDC035033 TaxID=3155368 RepID=UPI0033E31942
MCIEDQSEEKLGGMGYHYVNRDNIGSTDPERPAAVIYAKNHETGQRELVALEWVVPYTGQSAPHLFGKEFDGPELIPGLGEIYSLHAWLYKKNPSGLFAPYNPRVHCVCPEDAPKA